MSDIATIAESAVNAVGKVSPFAEGFFVIVIAFLGLMAWRRGEREGKHQSEAIALPTYLMAHDAAKAVTVIAQTSEQQIALHEKTNAVLEDIAKTLTHIDAGQIHTHRLLNALRNEQQLRGTMAHPERNGSGEGEAI